MNYSRIINRSFEIAWRYKSLWVFGMFASGGFANFNFNMPTGDSDGFGSGSFGMPEFPPELIGMFMMAIGALVLVFMVMGLISQAAIIDSVNRIDRGGRYRFGEAFSAGIDFFLRFLGLSILFFVSFAIAIGIVVVLAVIFFAVHTALGVLSLLILIPALLFSFFVLFSIFSLAERVIVVRNASIGDAIEEGWLLVKRNFGKTAMIFLIYIAFLIGFGIFSTIIWIIFSLPIAGLGLVAGLNPISALFAGIIIGLPVSLVIGGILGVFYTSLYTLFYFELVEPVQTAAIQTPPAAAPPLT
ncbi:MAG: hypothetical protein JSU74_01790 [Candidatus Zixiibacteriota bacterium]|nr:MAG: hypothetical protein JSU74_01790 [candidate division Zixibacteria bacterium]